MKKKPFVFTNYDKHDYYWPLQSQDKDSMRRYFFMKSGNLP